MGVAIHASFGWRLPSASLLLIFFALLLLGCKEEGTAKESMAMTIPFVSIDNRVFSFATCSPSGKIQ